MLGREFALCVLPRLSACSLGTVRAVVTGEKTGVGKAEIVSLTDYYPYGMDLPGRSFLSEAYRYGYQGSERDPEMSGGAGYTTYFRALDPRIGRWLTPDPKVFPWQSPYVSMDGNPVALVDPWGASTGGGKPPKGATTNPLGEGKEVTILATDLSPKPKDQNRFLTWLFSFDKPGSGSQMNWDGNNLYQIYSSNGSPQGQSINVKGTPKLISNEDIPLTSVHTGLGWNKRIGYLLKGSNKTITAFLDVFGSINAGATLGEKGQNISSVVNSSIKAVKGDLGDENKTVVQSISSKKCQQPSKVNFERSKVLVLTEVELRMELFILEIR